MIQFSLVSLSQRSYYPSVHLVLLLEITSPRATVNAGAVSALLTLRFTTWYTNINWNWWWVELTRQAANWGSWAFTATPILLALPWAWGPLMGTQSPVTGLATAPKAKRNWALIFKSCLFIFSHRSSFLLIFGSPWILDKNFNHSSPFHSLHCSELSREPH